MAVNTQRRNCLRARGREARCPEGGLGRCHSRRKLIQASLLMGSEGQRTTTVETTECVPVRSPGSGVGSLESQTWAIPMGTRKGELVSQPMAPRTKSQGCWTPSFGFTQPDFKATWKKASPLLSQESQPASVWAVVCRGVREWLCIENDTETAAAPCAECPPSAAPCWVLSPGHLIVCNSRLSFRVGLFWSM